MSDSILNKQIVIRLNKSWVAYDLCTVKEAVTFLCSEANGQKPGYAIDFETVTDENGEQTLAYTNTVSWEEWCKLPVREGDLAIGIGHGRQIRVPLVIICAHYNKVPEKRPRLSSGAIWERDGGVCQYTGEKVTRSTGNIDHVQPRDRGGRDTWENMVVARKDINTKKSNRLNSEVGLKLIRVPKAPKPTVKVLRVEDAKHPSQRPFLLK
jgi:5-methylcytosine-specific restriction endonuclease McrA